jgi:hypothetical protein
MKPSGRQYPAHSKKKPNCTGHILRWNCLLKHVLEGKRGGRIEVTGRGGGRRKPLLNDLKEKRGHRKSKEEALDCTVGRTRCGRGYRRVLRQTMQLVLVTPKFGRCKLKHWGHGVTVPTWQALCQCLMACCDADHAHVAYSPVRAQTFTATETCRDVQTSKRSTLCSYFVSL